MGREPDTRVPVPRERMVKAIDAWWTVLVIDPVATRLIPSLARHQSITPTRVTLGAHLLGIVTIGLFAGGWLLAGAVVFEVRFLADCLDGKLARVTNRSSRLGHLLDSFGDRVLTAATLGVLGWQHAPVATAILLAAYPLTFHLDETRHRLHTERWGPPTGATDGRGWTGALARRRLFPVPTSVDVEHVVLVVGPVLWSLGVDVLEPLVWAGAAYFALQGLRYLADVLRSAAALDRAAAGLDEAVSDERADGPPGPGPAAPAR